MYRIIVSIGLAVVVFISCSEKQKEAARLEEKMRDQLYADSFSQSRADGTLDAQTLSSSADSISQSQMPLVVDSPAAASESLHSSSVDSSQMPTMTEPAPVPDAGAIPDEEKIPMGAAERRDETSAYVIQIASTPDRSSAEQTLSTYIKQGYPAFVTTAIVHDITYYRVRIGTYSSAGAAERVRDELAKKFGALGFVAQVK